MKQILQISNIHQVFNKDEKNEVHALKNINLDLEYGQLVLFIGHNGSGKSTLLNIIDGRIAQTKGNISINRKNIDTLKVYERAKYMYRIFQNTLNSVIQVATIRENMAFAYKRNKKFKLMSTLVNKKDEKYFKEIISKYNITLANSLSKKVFTLSPGERQAVILSLLEIQEELEPQILLADEPTAALDPKMAMKFLEVIKNLSKKGWLCIVVTHDEKLIKSSLVDLIINFNHGEI